MSEPIVYDKAKYHFGGDYPKGLPIEQAFVHTGMFLGWILDHDLYNKEFKQDARILDAIVEFKSRKITGPKFFEEELDGVLLGEDLNEEGNEFTQYYFDFKKGKYLDDYGELLSSGLPSMYQVKDTWENYDKLKKRIDKRYEEWKSKKNKRVWEFWK